MAKESFYKQYTEEIYYNVINLIESKIFCVASEDRTYEDAISRDYIDSVSHLVSYSLPAETILKKYPLAIKYYEQLKEQGIPYDKEKFLKALKDNWENLEVLISNKPANDEKEEENTIDKIIKFMNNLEGKKTKPLNNKVNNKVPHMYGPVPDTTDEQQM